MSKFDESKHHRDHGQFATGAAIGAAAGATGGALLTGALLGRRLRGFAPLASRAVHAAEEIVHEAAPLAVRSPRPHQWSYLKHGVHTPLGRASRQSDPLLSHEAQAMSREVVGHSRISAKKLAQAEAIRAKRAKLAGEIRQWRRQGGMGKLAKFLDTQHPRDNHGRFSAGERRTQHKMPSYYRMVGRVPHGGTDPDRELPVGSFKRATLPFHKPAALTVEERTALERGVVGVITREREATVARGLEVRRGKTLIPEGTSKRTINRAYNHAALIAVHRYGLGHYDFAMDDELKAELTPLVPFMRYAERRVRNTMLSEHKGGWKPYREEFGQTFKDKRTDAEGNVRRRVKPLQQMIKAAEMGTLCKGVFDDARHARDAAGRFVSEGAQAVRELGAKVADVVVHPGAAIGRYAAKNPEAMMRAQTIKHFGLMGVGGYAAYRGLEAAGNYLQSGQIYRSVPELTQNTQPLTVTGDGYKEAREHGRAHLRDLMSRPVKRGRAPTEEELRRQFFRDSLARRERMVILDKDGKVLSSFKGTGTGVSPSLPGLVRTYFDIKNDRVGKIIHNHPVDTVASTPDSSAAASMKTKSKIGWEIYGFGRTADGKTRHTRTVFDGTPYARAEQAVKTAFHKEHGRQPNYFELEEAMEPFMEKDLTADEWKKAKRRGSIYNRRVVYEKAVPIGALSKVAFGAPKLPKVQKPASDEKPRDLVQPAQIAGAYIGATALGAAAVRPAARLASRATAFATPRIASPGIRRGVGTGVNAVFGIGASVLGDKLGDWASRRVTGAKGKEDQYRNLSGAGLGASIVGGVGAAKLGTRGLTAGTRAHTLVGTGLSILGGAAGEVAGNWAQRYFAGTKVKRPRAIAPPR